MHWCSSYTVFYSGFWLLCTSRPVQGIIIRHIMTISCLWEEYSMPMWTDLTCHSYFVLQLILSKTVTYMYVPNASDVNISCALILVADPWPHIVNSSISISAFFCNKRESMPSLYVHSPLCISKIFSIVCFWLCALLKFAGLTFRFFTTVQSHTLNSRWHYGLPIGSINNSGYHKQSHSW